MTYKKDTGPLDVFGHHIRVGDFIAVGSNNGISIGTVEAVKTNERHRTDWYTKATTIEYTYSITIQKRLGDGNTKRQTFSHDTMGESKFWKVDDAG